MPTATLTSYKLPINVGPLNGIDSFCAFTAEPLKRFSELYREGVNPEVEWDLRNVEPRHMSMAGLTAFLSTAHRLRQFTKDPPTVNLKWNPRIFTFWNDVSFFDLTEKHDILTWPNALVDNVWSATTSHNSEILFFDYSIKPPDRSSKLEKWKEWKDFVRQQFKDNLLLRCGRLFRNKMGEKEFPERLKDRVSIACAELVVNSLLWGESPAFVGLQRSRSKITVAVCDSGKGFLNSLHERHDSKPTVKPASHIEAVILGSFINTKEYGLRKVINTVVGYDGEVIISSFDAQMHWKNSLWVKAKKAATADDESFLNIKRLISSVGEPITGRPTIDDRTRGFFKVLPKGLRGVRIAFEIPIYSDERV